MAKPTQIYGIRAVIEAINAGETIDKVYIQKGLQGDLSKELEGLIRKKRNRVFRVGDYVKVY